MLLKCVCIVIQSATQAREDVILHLPVADTPKALTLQLWRAALQQQPPHPLLKHLPFSLGGCRILAGKYPECLQRMSNKGVPAREKSGSQIALQWTFHLFKEKWLKWKETGKTRLLHPNILITVEKTGKHEWQTLLQEFRAKNLRNRPLTGPQGFLFVCVSNPFLLSYSLTSATQISIFMR